MLNDCDDNILLVCNLLQSQDASIQTDMSENRAALNILPSSGLPERRQVMRDLQAIPLMLGSSSLEWATREMGAAFTMGGSIISSLISWESGGMSR